MSFIVAHFTATSIELMSGAKSRKWVHHNSTNQPTKTCDCDINVNINMQSADHLVVMFM